MDMLNTLIQLKGAEKIMSRQINITTQPGDMLLIDFKELENNHGVKAFKSRYYLLVDEDVLTTIEMMRLFRAWIDKDDNSFEYDGLMISEYGC